METIKNYLESMFRNLPKTEKVNRAKSELLQMMEDKYTELLAEGNSENEAVGTVISEFGNLDELAEDLGISEENTVLKTVSEKSRKVSYDEVINFLKWRKNVPIFRGLGIGFCICCVIAPIMADGLKINDIFGAVLMFIMIAIGVALIIFSNNGNQNWNYLRREPCFLFTGLPLHVFTFAGAL